MGEGFAGVLSWLFIAMFFAFVAVTLSRVIPHLTQHRGLLTSPNRKSVEPERIQSMVISLATVALLGYWGGQEIAANSGSLPDIPNSLLIVFGGSQFLFVGGRFLRNKGLI